MYRRVLDSVLKKILPTSEEQSQIQAKANEIISKIKKIKGSFVDVIFVGSAARGTNLRSRKEIDIFILFPESADESILEQEGLKIAKQVAEGYPYKIMHASHPYVKAQIDGYDVDLVPAFKLKSAEHIRSAVDRTPFHLEFVKKHLRKDQRKDVVLLKAFLKALDLYGAEMGTWGFPGYLCELLVIYYGDFISVLKAASKWQWNTVIDIAKHYNSSKDVLLHFKDPLIVVDPTDPHRNVASAVSDDCFAKFIHYSRSFLKNPSKDFFMHKKVIPKSISDIKATVKARGTQFYAIKLDFPKGASEDIVISQLLKARNKFKVQLEREDFVVHRSAVLTDNDTYAVILFEFSVWQLPKYRLHQGPLLTNIVDQERFINVNMSKGRSLWIESGRWFSEVERTHTDAKIALSHLLEGVVQNKQKIGSALREEFARSAKLWTLRDLLRFYSKNYSFAVDFTEYLYKRERFLEVE